MTERDELHLLTGAYALGALDEAERDRFEAYLMTSEEARAEVASLSDTAVVLGLASQPMAPPADLKAKLMAQIAVTPQLAPVTSKPTLVAVPSPATERAIRTIDMPTSSAERKANTRWYIRPVTVLVSAAAAVALFAGGAILGLSNNASNQPISQPVVSLGELTGASDLQRAEASVAGGGKATLVWSANLQRSAVIIDKLPALSGDKTYELWYIDKSGATPAGTFSAADSGKTVRVLDGKMSSGDTVGITVEPNGGSKKPTSAPIFALASA
ncbi:anti-sigma factor [Glaciihabitans sp. UYNi722]|uniref:anti-sigma factor n=1 Tax=Glaciihabitans sp. UYNi722 TaxID=3156344 RepID=UPI0033980773